MLVIVLERWDYYRRFANLGIYALVFVQVKYDVNLAKYRDSSVYVQRVAESFKSVAAIPEEPKGAKVFNCDWDRAPYIFYVRPDLRFVDILDPSLLYFANPSAYHSIEELQQGTLPDAYGLIRNAFHADYVLCGDPSIADQLRNEPGFRQIYPKVVDPSQSPLVQSIFRVLPGPTKELVRSISITEPGIFDRAKIASLTPPALDDQRREFDLEKSPYANLSAYKKPIYEGESAFCSFVTPSKEEVKRLAGADFLGLGGGPGFKVWRNGKPLFTTRAAFPNAKSIQVFLPLNPPLSATDHLETFVCAYPGVKFWGIELSFWTKKGIRDACNEKNADLTSTAADSSWPFEGIQLLTCLGPVSSPQKNRLLDTSESGVRLFK
jgi:hypothetical protein